MKKDFWDRNAKRYDRFMKKDAAAYRKMYGLIRPVVKSRTTLELATGTGLIAWNIAGETHTMEATDFSPDMIAQAKRESRFPSAKLHFSVQDMFHLPYADGSFDVVIVANALHIVPEPEQALRENAVTVKGKGGKVRALCGGVQGAMADDLLLLIKGKARFRAAQFHAAVSSFLQVFLLLQ